MTLFDIYACTNCGFMNGTQRNFIQQDKRKVCPDCGCDAQEFVQGPTHDRLFDDEEDNLWLD